MSAGAGSQNAGAVINFTTLGARKEDPAFLPFRRHSFCFEPAFNALDPVDLSVSSPEMSGVICDDTKT